MRRIVTSILALILLVLAELPAASVRAATVPPLAVRVSRPGSVTVTDAMLALAGWPLPLPRERVALTRHGQLLSLADTGSGFAFVGLPSESRWSSEAVYWLSIANMSAPRAPLPARLPTPLTWESDQLYERHQATARGDSWWAGELRGSQIFSVTLALPNSLPSGTPLQLQMRATENRSGHSVAVSANGQLAGVVTWSDGAAGAQVVTGTVSLPALPVGPLRVELALASAGDTILIDSLALPTVFPPAQPNAVAEPAPAAPLPTHLAGADLLIVTHATFGAALDPLIAAHRRLGRHVAVVDVQAAYDAYSFGERDPKAIRQLVRVSRPGAVLLVGLGTVALRQEEPSRPTFIPPYLLRDVRDGETACDTCYTRLNAGDPTMQLIPNLPIGRLPVTTLAEAEVVVAKTVAHLTAPPAGVWRSRALILADNDYQADGTPDPAGDFTATAEAGLASLPPGLAVTRLYYAPNLAAPSGLFEPDVARLRCRMFRLLDGGRASESACAAVDAAQSGVALWIYVGHGSMWQWASTTPQAPVPYLWYLYDADRLRNGARLPILLSMTCLSGDFANPILQTNDERLLLKAGGGVIASFSSSGEGVNTGHARLLRGMLARLYAASGDRTLGAAHLAGLEALHGATPDLAFAFALLGDPLVLALFVPVSSVSLPLVQR